MSMNWPTFRKRTLTALIFVIIMLTGMLWNEWSFFILFSIIHAGCWIEYHQLNRRIFPSYAALHVVLNAGMVITGWAFCFLCYYHSVDHHYFLYAGWIIGVIGLLMILSGLFLSRKAGLIAFYRALLGWLYISVSFALLMHIRSGAVLYFPDMDRPEDPFALIGGYIFSIVLMATIWINDTMAYIVGSFFGKRPLSPISPKKTWEGTIGGILITMILAFVCSEYIFEQDHGLETLIVVTIIAISGTFGDLLESKLKRMAGVKDSGTIMPGHGGFLDRFDSLLLATPFVWVYVWLTA